MMTTRRDYQSQPLSLACVLATFLCPVLTGCEKESEAIVSIARSIPPTQTSSTSPPTTPSINPVMPAPRGSGSRVSARDG